MYIRRLSAALAAAHLTVAAPITTSSPASNSCGPAHTVWSTVTYTTTATVTAGASSATTTSTSSSSSSTKSSTSHTMTTTTPSRTPSQTTSQSTASASGIWQPKAGTTWQYVLSDQITFDNTIEQYDVWDIDLFDNTADTVAKLHQRGRKVIAYFSAGTYENWRTDASKFASSDMGSALGDWPGEKWLNVRSANVRQIMLARLDLAVQKGFDGIDPDNMDAYGNSNGIGMTKADATDFALFLAQAAHARGLSIGLKNAGAIVPSVVSQMQYAVQEQSIQYGEESDYTPFIQAGKPVFNVEYPKGGNADDSSMNTSQNVDATTSQKICSRGKTMGFSTIIKNVKLDQWIQKC